MDYWFQYTQCCCDSLEQEYGENENERPHKTCSFTADVWLCGLANEYWDTDAHIKEHTEPEQSLWYNKLQVH